MPEADPARAGGLRRVEVLPLWERGPAPGPGLLPARPPVSPAWAGDGAPGRGPERAEPDGYVGYFRQAASG
ncbi:hypothetical protein OG535_35465 [Kitasatospora sp. NBC_00085]|uniref:hypothetical protein n=1 Tax=unclassified Kitasatospora TaxID=2633591 RepID=UPI00324EC5EF